MASEGLSEAALASCMIMTFSPHVGISIALMLAALVICFLLTLFAFWHKNGG